MTAYLIAVHHEMVSGDKGLEHHNPALIGRPFNQRVSQMRYTHTQLIGAVHQIWAVHRNRDTNDKGILVEVQIYISPHLFEWHFKFVRLAGSFP